MKIKIGFFCTVALLGGLLACSRQMIKTEESEPVPEPVKKTVEQTPKTEPKNIRVQETAPVRRILVFQDVNFDFDKYELRSDALEILTDHARLLKENPQVKLLLEGHCDEWGTIEYNLALGERRASAVKTYLLQYGINSKRLSTISYGKERPLDTRHNETAWAKNRRVAFLITEQ